MRMDKLTSKFQQALSEAQSLAVGRDLPADAVARDAWIRVGHRHHDATDASPNDRVGAGRRPAVMTARLKIHVQRSAARVRVSMGEGVHLRMRAADGVMKPFRNDAGVFDNDRADKRIRIRAPPPFPGKLKRPRHEKFVSIDSHGFQSLRFLAKRGVGNGNFELMVEQAFLPVHGTEENVCPTKINMILPLPEVFSVILL